MRFGLLAFRGALILIWCGLVYLTIKAAWAMGPSAAITTFYGDMAHPWRAQANSDLMIHLLLIASWMIWRSRRIAPGVVSALLAINLGALFTLPYIFIESIRTGGDMRRLLLGHRAAA